MAELKTIPNERMRDVARSKGVNPVDYVKGRTRMVDPTDIRLKGKYGELMEDYMIVRSDNSRVSIHEAGSDVERLHKVRVK